MLGKKILLKKVQNPAKLDRVECRYLWPCTGLKQSSQQKYLLVNQYTPSPPWSKGKTIFKILFIQKTKQNKNNKIYSRYF